MADRTTKDFFGDGYTTTHDDGTSSHTTKDFFGDGYTTVHSDGSTSHTTKDFFGDGYTTVHSDGSSSHTTKDFFGDGYTITHSDGSTSHTTKDFFGDGYTTTHNSYTPGAFSGSARQSHTSALEDYVPIGPVDGPYFGFQEDRDRAAQKKRHNPGFAKLFFLYVWVLIAFACALIYTGVPVLPLLPLCFLVLLLCRLQVHRKNDDARDCWAGWLLLVGSLVFLFVTNSRRPMEQFVEHGSGMWIYILPFLFILAPVVLGIVCYTTSLRASGAREWWEGSIFCLIITGFGWAGKLLSFISFGYYKFWTILVFGFLALYAIINLIRSLKHCISSVYMFVVFLSLGIYVFGYLTGIQIPKLDPLSYRHVVVLMENTEPYHLLTELLTRFV